MNLNSSPSILRRGQPKPSTQKSTYMPLNPKPFKVALWTRPTGEGVRLYVILGIALILGQPHGVSSFVNM